MDTLILTSAEETRPLSPSTGETDPSPAIRPIQLSDIFEACKTGDLGLCKLVVERFGAEVVLHHDPSGHTPLHWACLCGSNDTIRYFISLSAPLNNPSSDKLAPRPIHWACVNGHVSTVELLLHHGVSIDTVDSRQCSPLIYSAMYGHVMLTAFLVSRGAQKDLVDIEGDNALHWACFKGHPDISRMLLSAGLNPGSKDYVGQTPLHLAALGGNLECVQMVCLKDSLTSVDNNGKTPLVLAQGKGYAEIIQYLRAESKSFSVPSVRLWKPVRILYWLRILICFLVWYKYRDFILATNSISMVVFILLMLLVPVLYGKILFSEPGYAASNPEEYENVVRQISTYLNVDDSSNLSPSRLCHQCRLVKPFRTVHCSICQRCVRDHEVHDPVLNKCIGPTNRVLYFVLNVAHCLLLVVFSFVGVQIARNLQLTFLETTMLLFVGLSSGFYIGAIIFQVIRISMNITPHEQLNWVSLPYLRDEFGHFTNPFHQGCLRNWLAYLRLTRGSV